MLPHYAFLGNSLLFLLMASMQMGVFGDLFDDEDNDDASGGGAPVGANITPEPLYIASLYDGSTMGTDAGDRFVGAEGEGDQAYFLGAGNDTLDAASGDDYAQGGSGDDRLLMRGGADLALGGSGNDQIFGGAGDDTLFGGEGNDRLEGSTGDDLLHGDDGGDQLAGGRGNDTLRGGAGNDQMSGDRFEGIGGIERGVDTLDGGAGDDTLWLFGQDSGTGGDGADLFRVVNANDGETLVTITDFDPEADQIEVIYSEIDGSPAPTLSVEAIDGTNDAQLLLNGQAVATVVGGADLASDDVALTSTL